MNKINVEIKAKCKDIERIRKILESENARFEGTDLQKDTYFQTLEGRLKLRQGNIEKCLISYHRPNQAGPKRSDITLYHTENTETLRKMLSRHLGVKVVVDKVRDIYFIDNIRFHLDSVKNLGTFVEIESCSDDPNDENKLLEQTKEYIQKFGIKEEDLIDHSYSDMLIEKNEL